MMSRSLHLKRLTLRLRGIKGANTLLDSLSILEAMRSKCENVRLNSDLRWCSYQNDRYKYEYFWNPMFFSQREAYAEVSVQINNHWKDDCIKNIEPLHEGFTKYPKWSQDTNTFIGTILTQSFRTTLDNCQQGFFTECL